MHRAGPGRDSAYRRSRPLFPASRGERLNLSRHRLVQRGEAALPSRFVITYGLRDAREPPICAAVGARTEPPVVGAELCDLGSLAVGRERLVMPVSGFAAPWLAGVGEPAIIGA
jgi:hypothetical protein